MNTKKSQASNGREWYMIIPYWISQSNAWRNSVALILNSMVVILKNRWQHHNVKLQFNRLTTTDFSAVHTETVIENPEFRTISIWIISVLFIPFNNKIFTFGSEKFVLRSHFFCITFYLLFAACSILFFLNKCKMFIFIFYSFVLSKENWMVDRARDNHDWLHLNFKRWHFSDGRQTKLQCKPLTKIDKIRIKHPSWIFLVSNRFHFFFLATLNPTDSNIHTPIETKKGERER